MGDWHRRLEKLVSERGDVQRNSILVIGDQITAYEEEIRRLATELSMMRHHWSSPEEVGRLSKELEDISNANARLLIMVEGERKPLP